MRSAIAPCGVRVPELLVGSISFVRASSS